VIQHAETTTNSKKYFLSTLFSSYMDGFVSVFKEATQARQARAKNESFPNSYMYQSLSTQTACIDDQAKENARTKGGGAGLRCALDITESKQEKKNIIKSLPTIADKVYMKVDKLICAMKELHAFVISSLCLEKKNVFLRFGQGKTEKTKEKHIQYKSIIAGLLLAGALCTCGPQKEAYAQDFLSSALGQIVVSSCNTLASKSFSNINDRDVRWIAEDVLRNGWEDSGGKPSTFNTMVRILDSDIEKTAKREASYELRRRINEQHRKNKNRSNSNQKMSTQETRKLAHNVSHKLALEGDGYGALAVQLLADPYNEQIYEYLIQKKINPFELLAYYATLDDVQARIDPVVAFAAEKENVKDGRMVIRGTIRDLEINLNDELYSYFTAGHGNIVYGR
jgi:hypothetical protein